MPFFDWYGGEGSSSHRKIIVKGLHRPMQTNELGSDPEDSSLLGKGKFSRVIRCVIKEESRTKQTSQSAKSNFSAAKETDKSAIAEASNYSQEMAVKVTFSIYSS